MLLLITLFTPHANSQIPPDLKKYPSPIRDRLMALFCAGENICQDGTPGQTQYE